MRSVRCLALPAMRPAAVLALALALAACTGSPAAPATASAPASAARTPAASSAARTSSPASPASRSAAPSAPQATAVGTTQTPWGRILDAVPEAFPVFPGATVADAPPDGAVSGEWVSKAPVSEVAGWYRDALRAANFAKVDLGNALEDGSRVVDAQGDLPECKVQVTAKPQSGSTMISVLVGAGCGGGSG